MSCLYCQLDPCWLSGGASCPRRPTEGHQSSRKCTVPDLAIHPREEDSCGSATACGWEYSVPFHAVLSLSMQVSGAIHRNVEKAFEKCREATSGDQMANIVRNLRCEGIVGEETLQNVFTVICFISMVTR